MPALCLGRGGRAGQQQQRRPRRQPSGGGTRRPACLPAWVRGSLPTTPALRTHRPQRPCITHPTPAPTLGRLLAPAVQVGYVACPSICGANADVSWAVRGRLFFESYFHGSLGATMSRDFMPFCIGSHYVVRTAHLKIAGGLGPELDEDMSTSYIMTANGFKVRRCRMPARGVGGWWRLGTVGRRCRRAGALPAGSQLGVQAWVGWGWGGMAEHARACSCCCAQLGRRTHDSPGPSPLLKHATPSRTPPPSCVFVIAGRRVCLASTRLRTAMGQPLLRTPCTRSTSGHDQPC